jgi:cyanophycinase
MASVWPDTVGRLVAIGGSEDKEAAAEILARILSLVPKGNNEVTLIATASGIPDEVVPAYGSAFERLGATRFHTLGIRKREDAADPERVRTIEGSGAIFFTGGDQLRLTAVLGGSPVLRAIRERFKAGAVVAGTSAGAVALSATMIYNGGAADALKKGAVKMTSGLGFVDNMIIDSHFLARGRVTRLMAVGATNPEHLGVGLGEDAAVIVHPDRTLEALGSGHVILIDSRGVASSNVADMEMGDPIAIENIIMHALIRGHGYDIDARTYLSPDVLRSRIGK